MAVTKSRGANGGNERYQELRYFGEVERNILNKYQIRAMDVCGAGRVDARLFTSDNNSGELRPTPRGISASWREVVGISKLMREAALYVGVREAVTEGDQELLADLATEFGLENVNTTVRVVATDKKL